MNRKAIFVHSNLHRLPFSLFFILSVVLLHFYVHFFLDLASWKTKKKSGRPDHLSIPRPSPATFSSRVCYAVGAVTVGRVGFLEAELCVLTTKTKNQSTGGISLFAVLPLRL
jgi:hypothetical protein